MSYTKRWQCLVLNGHYMYVGSPADGKAAEGISGNGGRSGRQLRCLKGSNSKAVNCQQGGILAEVERGGKTE